ncbi:MAG: hypothetical protein O3A84_16950 [Proteobacteria bacterium]|nr:hypothetical protein [Pseudomonadota bacterium]
MPEFEVAIFNQQVRDKVREGERHRDLSDDWADVHYIEVEAEDVSAARAKIQRKYPADRGYVIESVISM